MVKLKGARKKVETMCVNEKRGRCGFETKLGSRRPHRSDHPWDWQRRDWRCTSGLLVSHPYRHREETFETYRPSPH